MNGKVERINLLLSESKQEIEKIIDNIILHANTSECRQEMLRAQTKLVISTPVTMIEAIEMDDLIKHTLTEYSMEYLKERNSLIDAGTGLIISAILDERNNMFSSGINTNRTTAFKEFKRKYKHVMGRRELKEKFTAKYVSDIDLIKKYKEKVEKMGRAVTAYHINCRVITHQEELKAVETRIAEIESRFDQTTDSAEHVRLENEYQSLLDSKDAIDLNLQILLQNKSNMSGFEDILKGTALLNRLENIKTVTKEQIEAAALKYNTGLKQETNKQTEINAALEKVSASRNRITENMNNNAKVHQRQTLAQRSQERMNRELMANVAVAGGSNSKKTAVKTKIPKLDAESSEQSDNFLKEDV